ncbi:DUF1780 domain-containing protein [Rheinheimera soli]|uniref:Uncharacterized protein n=1 Tax=Rheinheimera soli TaxID=443616 RepID=A0ABU1VUW2_9GAMM|nr:DUF1780 domain-containing protein [Rheinheimera soli]MDR7119497.1 hypothetical protein [Rheinheimera soli]
MNEREILKHLQKSAWEDVEYFSNRKKEERERWVVSEFLSVLGLEYHDAELQSLEQDNKADVRFRNALFQVKELPDPNLRRGKMYKDVYKSIKEATSLQDVLLVGDARDVPPLASIYELVLEKAAELANSETYKASKSGLDLLIYATRTRASLIQSHEIKGEEFSDLGWRSVSCVNSKQAVVLFSSQFAPVFILEKVSKINEQKWLTKPSI